MLRRKYRIPTVIMGKDFDIPVETDISDDIVSDEEATNLRREVAYLAESYRSVIVKYYFHNKSIKDIAEEFGLANGTVKSRLDFGRKQVKKGLESMEKYQENSNMPQYLAVRNSGMCGMNEEPMSLTEGDVLAQNLLILAYDKPLAVSELAKAIGVAAAYVEPVVEIFVNGERKYFYGLGVDVDYNGPIPEEFVLTDVIPESYYIVFNHPPFEYLSENSEVMKRVEDLAWNFDPKTIGYEWNETECQDYQRHYPEVIGYQVLRPVKKIK